MENLDPDEEEQRAAKYDDGCAAFDGILRGSREQRAEGAFGGTAERVREPRIYAGKSLPN